MTDDPTIAVTGAAGYIGSRVVDRIQTVHPEWNVRAFDNYYLGSVRRIGNTDVEFLDIRNRSRLEKALDGSDIVMHLAAISGVDDCEANPDLSYEVNIQGTNNVAWFCRKSGTGLVFPFSMAVLGDPERFPITTDLPRSPLNWYGQTKVASERAIESLAEGSFPAHLYLKSNLYGAHEINGESVSKPTVINFFVNRATAGETLTVYEPGTQSRNFIHVKDVANAYLRSGEYMLNQLAAGETGVSKYEIASDEDPSVREIAELVRDTADSVLETAIDIELVENPRGNETLVSEFTVDTSKARTELGWEVDHSVSNSIRSLLNQFSK